MLLKELSALVCFVGFRLLPMLRARCSAILTQAQPSSGSILHVLVLCIITPLQAVSRSLMRWHLQKDGFHSHGLRIVSNEVWYYAATSTHVRLILTS